MFLGVITHQDHSTICNESTVLVSDVLCTVDEFISLLAVRRMVMALIHFGHLPFAPKEGWAGGIESVIGKLCYYQRIS